MTSTEFKIKRKKTTTTSSSSYDGANNNSTKLPPVDLDSLQIGSYADLLNDFVELTLCKVNRKPDPSIVTADSKEEDEENDEDTVMDEDTDTTKKKRKRVPKPPKYDTTIPYDKSILAAKERYELHLEQCRTVPATVEIFNDLRELLVAPTYNDPACPDERKSYEEAVYRLKTRNAFLSILESDHADVLLQEAGVFPISTNPREKHIMRDFPPCMHGTKCFVNSGRLQVDPSSVVAFRTSADEDLEAKTKERQKQGFICMQYMDKQTYDRFISTGTPPKPAPCVICCRYQLTAYVPLLRAERQKESQGIVSSSVDATEEEEGIRWPIIEHDPTNPLQFFRERMDKPGGYLSGCMLIPNQGVWEGFLDPISMILLGRLLIKQRNAPGGGGGCINHPRRYVNQDLMKYQPDPIEIPHTALTFAAAQLRYHVSTVLLRHPNAALSFFELTNPLPPTSYDATIIQSNTCPEDSYAFSVALDASIMNPVSKASSSSTSKHEYTEQLKDYYQKDERGYTRVICEDTLEPLFNIIHCIAFFEHISQTKDSLIHILSKLVVVKCRIRKSNDVWNRQFNIPESLANKERLATKDSERKMYARMIAKRTGIRSKMCIWVLCSLLGNYRHCLPSSRSYSTTNRSLLYDIFMYHKNHQFVDKLMHRCGNLFNFAMREYIVYAVENMPAFHRQLSKLFDWNSFRTTVITAMDTYRVWLNTNQLNNKESSIWKSIIDPSSTSEFFDYSCQHFQTCHHQLKHYYASIFTAESIFKKKRTKITLAENPIQETKTVHELTDEELEIEINKAFDDETNMMIDQEELANDEEEDDFDITVDAYKQMHLNAIDARELEREAATHRKTRSLVYTKYMPQLHIDAMKWIVSHHINKYYPSSSSSNGRASTYVPTSTLIVLIRYSKIFGIAKPIAKRALLLVLLLQKGEWSANEKHRQIQNLRDTEPYMYTLIQCCVDMIAKHMEILIVTELPEHYWIAQVDAIQTRYPWTKVINGLPFHPTLCYYCRHCKSTKIYTLKFDTKQDQVASTTITKEQPDATAAATTPEAEPTTTTKKKKKVKTVILNSYLRMDNDVEDMENRKWCRRNRGTRYPECDIDPLCCPSVLGRIIKIRDHLILLCSKCGFGHIYIPSRCGVMDTGIVCSICTQKEENNKYITKYDLMLQWGYPAGQETASCELCPKRMKKTSSIYMYPFCILLCSKCSCERLSNLIDAKSNELNTRKKMMDFMIDFKRKRRQRKNDKLCKKTATYGGMEKNSWLNQVSDAF